MNKKTTAVDLLRKVLDEKIRVERCKKGTDDWAEYKGLGFDIGRYDYREMKE